MTTSKQITTIQAQLQAFSVANYAFQAKVAAKHGLHPTDLLAINALSVRQKMTAKELSEVLSLSSGATTAAVDRLVGLGFVVREPGEADRRQVFISLNKSGLKQLAQEYAPVAKKIEGTLQRYDQQQLDAITSFLDEVLQSPQE